MSRWAFVFPGQGSQHPGMGRALCEAYAESRDVFEAADAALGDSISEICFGGTDEQLSLTENTQPAVLTVCVAALQALLRRNVRPDAAAGHSLGEYAAHVAAGTLRFDDAVRAVRARGRFMQEAVPVGRGAMAALLGLDLDRVEAICREVAEGEVVSAANLNGPGQVVIAGHSGAVERAVERARSDGAKRAVTLPVSAPFHCALMEPAARRLEDLLAKLPFEDPSIAVYCNVDAATVSEADAARQALVRQVASPVRWEESIRAMLAAGIDSFVEVGPGRVLSGLIRRIDREAKVLPAGNPEEVERVAAEVLGEA